MAAFAWRIMPSDVLGWILTPWLGNDVFFFQKDGIGAASAEFGTINDPHAGDFVTRKQS
jgi:hypothetical protein